MILKSFIIDFKLNFTAITQSIYTIKQSLKASFSILLRSVVLTGFVIDNAHSVVVEKGRESTS